MARKYFLFLYPSEPKLRALLNIAIFALNPEEKWPAHVTVAGPFSKRPSYVRQLPPHTTAFSLGLGNFFPQGINTVYLRIGLPEIRHIWNKPDFRGNPVPHVSLYNGRDSGAAGEVYKKLRLISPFFSFIVSNPTIVSSTPGQEIMDLREQVNPDILPLSRGLSIDELRRLNFDDRLSIAESAILECLPKARQPRDIFNLIPPTTNNMLEFLKRK